MLGREGGREGRRGEMLGREGGREGRRGEMLGREGRRGETLGREGGREGRRCYREGGREGGEGFHLEGVLCVHNTLMTLCAVRSQPAYIVYTISNT